MAGWDSWVPPPPTFMVDDGRTWEICRALSLMTDGSSFRNRATAGFLQFDFFGLGPGMYPGCKGWTQACWAQCPSWRMFLTCGLAMAGHLWFDGMAPNWWTRKSSQPAD